MIVDAIKPVKAGASDRRSAREILSRLWAKAAEIVKERFEPPPDEMRISSNRVNLPNWLVLYLLAQIVGGVWWAATKDAKIAYLEAENYKLWQKAETHDLQLGKLDKIVRDAVKEAMADANYVRIGRDKGD